MSELNCANCGALLTGPYCAVCGQHAHESARSVSVLFHDAWHVVTHVDSRFWQTMYTLLLRPGRLTQEYFAERRARYLPPVRVYLVLSVLFFALGAGGPRVEFETRAAEQNAHRSAVADVPDAHRYIAEALRQPAADDVIAQEPDNATRFVFDTNDCDSINSSFKWLQKPLRAFCRRNLAKGGEPLRDAFVANIPKMMFVFLPMVALVMLLLYWRPRRYYVEHLVFFLHTHAAMFLILLLEVPVSWAVAAVPSPKSSSGLVTLGTGVYAAWYVYRAMRVYYGQGRWLTVAKLAVVAFAYMIFLSITLLATLIISALFA
jgi:hypothetical protein